ncbi:MAG: sigma-70 family RNA polymerase sigma factor [Pseudomonadota bacterium]
MSSQAVLSTAASIDLTNAVSGGPQQDAIDPLARHLRAVARADRRAFDIVYTATVDRALHLVTRIVGDASLAEDVVSDVYLLVWEQAGRFDPDRGAVIAWILTICRNRALDTVRRRSVAAKYVATYEKNQVDAEDAHQPDDLLAATDDSSRIHKVLKTIASEDRQLLALAFFKGYTHAELAAITGEPLGTIKSRIRRTMAKLKELLRDTNMEVGEER